MGKLVPDWENPRSFGFRKFWYAIAESRTSYMQRHGASCKGAGISVVLYNSGYGTIRVQSWDRREQNQLFGIVKSSRGAEP